MHSSVITDSDGVEWRIDHNGDWSGAVRVIGTDLNMSPRRYKDQLLVSVDLPFDLLEIIVLRQRRDAAVEELESLDDDDLRNRARLKVEI